MTKDADRRAFLRGVLGAALASGLVLPRDAEALNLDLNGFIPNSFIPENIELLPDDFIPDFSIDDIIPGGFFRSKPKPKGDHRTLSMRNLHTGESIRKVTFWEKGKYHDDALSEINYVLRDFRSGDVADMDTDLLNLLCCVQQKLGTSKEFHIISGYRSAKTNDMLRRRSGGVAKNSYHTRGQAIDIQLPGHRLKDIKNVALSLKGGGVGYYSQSGFVHLDTGKVRTWGA